MRQNLIILTLICLLVPLDVVGDTIQARELQVAVVLGLTGGAATNSDSIRKGVELAADSLRKQGWQIDLVFEDDQTNSAKTVSAFRSLLSRGYQYFIGPTWSFQAKAVMPLLSKSEAIVLMPAGSSLINGGAHPNFFNLCPRRDRQRGVLARWLAEQAKTRGLIFTPNGDWGEIHRKVFSNSIRDSSGQVLGDEQFDYGVDLNSVKAVLMKARKAGVNIVFTTGAGSDMANVIRARNQLELDLSIVATDDLRDAVRQGLLSPSAFRAGDMVLHLPTNGDFQVQFEPKYGELPLLHADHGYDALMLLSHVLSKSDGRLESVRTYLHNHIDYKGSSGRIRFDGNGDLKDGTYLLSAAVEGITSGLN